MTVGEIIQLCVTATALIIGPIAGVILALALQRRKEKRDAKMRAFMVLMAHRKTMPPVQDLVNHLNLVDLVFEKERDVVHLWHEYFDLLCHEPLNMQLVEPKYLDLLASMAKSLGYKELAQTDIARFYSPKAFASQTVLNMEIQTELLRVLKGTQSLSSVPQQPAATH